MIHLPKTKLVFVTVLAIATLTSNPAPGWTQPSSRGIANQPSAPGTGTPKGQRTAGGNRLDMPPPPDSGTRDSQRTPAGTHGDMPPPPDSGTPDGHRAPGGTRPGQTTVCKQTDKPLTALLPENGEGLTTGEYPVFWFYIPYTPQDINSIEFSLHDREEKTTLYRTSLQLSKTPGVIGISLPPSPEHALKLNQSYHWRFIVNCDRKQTSEDVLELDGWVQRVQPSPNQVIWYDELTNLAKRYLIEPQNPEVKKAWSELLKSVGLEGFAQAPLVMHD